MIYRNTMQLILRTLLRTFQAQIAKKIRTFGSGSASAQKNDVLTKKKSVVHWKYY